MSSYRIAEQRLARLLDSGAWRLVKEHRIGLEKESLRVNREGTLSTKPHPAALGSALTHPYITTDYSEALIELITPPLDDGAAALQFLCEAQQFVYSVLDEELLWATSMPCVVRGETSIPIAYYGTSNAGRMKHIYRRGLGHRYGRVMQVIAGVHFNYSLSNAFWSAYRELEGDGRPLQESISESYLGLIRNLQRFGWLVPFLFGASPAVCKSFLSGQPTDMPSFDDTTYYQPYATSLRMGDIGYQNNKENVVGVKACYDSLDAYIDSLVCAISTPAPQYERIGVKVDGEYRQLNANVLQIENEYYSTIRPKQVVIDNERPTLALKRRGIGYVELRSLDVNPYDPLGISAEQIAFLEAFLLFCLLHDSPPLSEGERREVDDNELLSAHRGREPGLLLRRRGEAVELRQWGLELCARMEGVCALLDRDLGDTPHARALQAQREKLIDPELTPSARMLTEMRANEEGFYDFGLRISRQHREYFRARELPAARRRFFEEEAWRSLQAQQALEASDDVTFEEYLARYYAQ